jgi:hypothetical protein
MEFTAATVLTIVRDDPMLARFHEETVRSLLRLQKYGGYSRDDAVERFTKLVRAARLKLGFPLHRGRISQSDQHEKNVAIDMLLDGFEQEHPFEYTPVAPEAPRVHYFTPPKNWKPRIIEDLSEPLKEPLKPPGEWMPLGEDDPGFVATQDHEPDLEGVGESAYFISCSQSIDPRSEHPVPELPDAYEGLSAIDALTKNFQASVFMDIPAQDPYAPLSWQSRVYLRRLDTQTYEDYLLDHVDEIAEESVLNGYVATNPPGPEGSNGKATVSADEMWEDYLRTYPPLQRLELLKRYGTGKNYRGED